MKSPLWSLIRKGAVLLVGVPVVIVGIILIPLPGPGLLVTLGGFLILAIEFEWARRHVDRLKRELKKVTDRVKAQRDTKK